MGIKYKPTNKLCSNYRIFKSYYNCFYLAPIPSAGVKKKKKKEEKLNIST